MSACRCRSADKLLNPGMAGNSCADVLAEESINAIPEHSSKHRLLK
jgi:hypothetical protein